MTQSELDEVNKGNVWKLVMPVDTPSAPQQSSVGSGDWVDALHRAFERRADRWETELGNEMVDGRMVAQELRTLIAAYRAGTGSASTMGDEPPAVEESKL